jgi:hypothetical protein
VGLRKRGLHRIWLAEKNITDVNGAKLILFAENIVLFVAAFVSATDDVEKVNIKMTLQLNL